MYLSHPFTETKREVIIERFSDLTNIIDTCLKTCVPLCKHDYLEEIPVGTNRCWYEIKRKHSIDKVPLDLSDKWDVMWAKLMEILALDIVVVCTF